MVDLMQLQPFSNPAADRPRAFVVITHSVAPSTCMCACKPNMSAIYCSPLASCISLLQAMWRSGGLRFDICLLLLMLGDCILLSWFAIQNANSTTPAPEYDTYDAITLAQARWLLPRKASDVGLSPAPATVPAGPGSRGRWALPSSDKAFDQLAELLLVVQRSADLWTWYGLLQGVTLVLLIVR